jgi:hypothetical protein
MQRDLFAEYSFYSDYSRVIWFNLEGKAIDKTSTMKIL